MKFDLFVLPFTAGLIFMLGYLAFRYSLWFYGLKKVEQSKIITGFFSFRLFGALREIVSESLLHRKIFHRNRLLGFMHMSLAFGWFLLIAIGNLESRFFQPSELNPPYIPIFFRYFHANPGAFPMHQVFSFTMDLLLLFVLTGVMLALAKRVYSKAYGMKRTTRLKPGDRFALISLWLIFPLRFLAESFTSSVFGGGSFLTATTGHFLGGFLPSGMMYYPAWWAYSMALGVFFVSLPFSRYMHIPTEVVLIFSRRFGLAETNTRTSFTEIEINSCSRCGICLDACQLSFAGGVHTVQSAYQLKAIRYNNIQLRETLNCLMCGRCENACPVGIDISGIRLITRNELNGKAPDPSFAKQSMPRPRTADVIYFAGCMTHQTPSVKKAMKAILTGAGVKFWFMDEEGGMCCGRPMMLAGHSGQASILMEKNRSLIRESGAQTLVTSCPICFKIFTREYNLNIRVVHHTQYLLELTDQRKIHLEPVSMQAVYHDPCELSRDLRVYDEPRTLLNRILNLNQPAYEKDNALCCGSSLANISASNELRLKVARDAYEKINPGDSRQLITSCPLCKKAFEKVTDAPVRDVAEIVRMSMQKQQLREPLLHQKITASSPSLVMDWNT
jgi:Fe-S oxidoreductase